MVGESTRPLLVGGVPCEDVLSCEALLANITCEPGGVISVSSGDDESSVRFAAEVEDANKGVGETCPLIEEGLALPVEWLGEGDSDPESVVLADDGVEPAELVGEGMEKWEVAMAGKYGFTESLSLSLPDSDLALCISRGLETPSSPLPCSPAVTTSIPESILA